MRARGGLGELDLGGGAGDPGGVGVGRRGRDAFGDFGALAVLGGDGDLDLVGLGAHVAVEVAEADEGGLIDEDAADALALRAVHEGERGGGDDLGVGGAGLVDGAVLGVAVHIDDGDVVGALDGELAVIGLSGIGRGDDGGEEVAVAAAEADELGLLLVARLGGDLDIGGLAEGGEDGEVLVRDVDVDALPRLDEDHGVGGVVFGDGGADHLVRLGGAGPPAGVEVDLADEEEGVVREEARRVVLRDAAENHGGVTGLAAGELALALEEERLGLELAVRGAEGLAEVGDGLVELALVDLIAAELKVGVEARGGVGEHLRDGLQHADGAVLLVVLEEFLRVLDHALGAGLDLLGRAGVVLLLRGGLLLGERGGGRDAKGGGESQCQTCVHG